MPWRHLITLLLLAGHTLLGMLLYFGILSPFLQGLDEGTLSWAHTLWRWAHAPAILAAQYLDAGYTLLTQHALGLFGRRVVVLVGVVAQDVVLGYLIGGFFDLPWNKVTHAKEEALDQDEEMHRDLKIAARVLDRVEQAEKQKLQEKVERLKRQAKEKAEAKDAAK